MACAPAAVADDETPDQTLRLRGGDRIRGTLGVVDDTRLEWRRPDLTAPVRFHLASVRSLLATPASTMPDGQVLVRLTNGDEVPCTITALDDTALTVQTAFAGDLTIPRGMVVSVQMPSTRRSTGLFTGLRDLGNFRQTGGGWEMKDGALSGTGGIIFQTAMPDSAYVSVDVEWTGEKPDFSVITHANNSSYYHYGYNAYISGNTVTLNRGTRMSYGGTKTFDLPASKKITLEMFVDRAKGEVEVRVNHRVVNKWSTGYNSGQSYIGFAVNGNEKAVFTNLEITQLDEARTTEANTTDQDRVGFAQADRLTGHIQAIADGKLVLKTHYGDLNIPLKQVGDIAFAGKSPLKARKEKADVRIHLPSGGIVTVALGAIKDGVLTGSSENYGEVTLDLSYITRMDFHIYEKREDDEVGMIAPSDSPEVPVPHFEDMQIEGGFRR
jgi:hypothetical protein